MSWISIGKRQKQDTPRLEKAISLMLGTEYTNPKNENPLESRFKLDPSLLFLSAFPSSFSKPSHITKSPIFTPQLSTNKNHQCNLPLQPSSLHRPRHPRHFHPYPPPHPPLRQTNRLKLRQRQTRRTRRPRPDKPGFHIPKHPIPLIPRIRITRPNPHTQPPSPQHAHAIRQYIRRSQPIRRSQQRFRFIRIDGEADAGPHEGSAGGEGEEDVVHDAAGVVVDDGVAGYEAEVCGEGGEGFVEGPHDV